MDNVASLRRTHTSKKGNKENTQPVSEISFIKREKTSAAPFQLKGNKKVEAFSTDDPLKAKVKPAAVTSVSSATLKKAVVAQRASSATDIQRQTNNRVIITKRDAKIKKVPVEARKPPAAIAQVKAAPGLYKGRIIQSKIGSIWKSSSSLTGPDPRPSAARLESARVGNVAKSRSKSVSEVPVRGIQQPAVTRSKSTFHKRTQATKPTASSRPAAALPSTQPPTRTIPLVTKPKVLATDRKVSKPPASSSLSQYRLNTETAEERRAKLAEWLASKGKTLKRPAMTASAAPAKHKTIAKPSSDPEPLSGGDYEPESAGQRESGLDGHVVDSTAAPQCADRWEEPTASSKTPLVMETSLQLLGVSELDPHEGVEDIVVNLCHVLEAMEMPSGCSEDCTQVTRQCNGAEMESSEPEEAKDEKSDGVNEMEESEEKERTEDEEESDEDVKASPRQADEASMIKYSIKTTPYLQSVKRTLEDEAGATSSRKKINIGDLKLVTPVRRSSRIQRTSSRLPAMLQDHDPSVSSLAELVTMDDNPHAFICRRNAALLDELPGDASHRL